MKAETQVATTRHLWCRGSSGQQSSSSPSSSYHVQDCWPEEPRHHKWRVVATCVSALMDSTLYTSGFYFLECEVFFKQMIQNIVPVCSLAKRRIKKIMFLQKVLIIALDWSLQSPVWYILQMIKMILPQFVPAKWTVWAFLFLCKNPDHPAWWSLAKRKV